jgi:uncharacterized protein (DUF1501 family)
MAISRRQFLRRGGIAAAGGLLGPGFFGRPWLQRSLADTIGDRYFVSLYLDGGNDGLNTVVPYSDGSGSLRTHYETARRSNAGGILLDDGPGSGGIEGLDQAMPSTPFLDPNTGAQLSFHPGLQAFRDFYDAGHLAVIQGCGYPESNLSHDVSTSIWETGDPIGNLVGSKGWAGRHLEAEYNPTDIPAVTIDSRVAGELQQTGTSVLAIRRLSRFGFPYDFEYPGDEAAKQAAFDAIYADVANNAVGIEQFIGNTGVATALAAQSYPGLHYDYRDERGTFDAKYDNALIGGATSTSRDLREVAKIIYGVAKGEPNVNARFFQVRNGGYDTHSDQGGGDPDGRHYRLHREVSAALEIFFDDLADMASGQTDGRQNLPEKVCVLIWSEFSRRITQNDNGTDHGTQGPMFLIGHGVNGGVVGNHPDIDPTVIENNNGNTIYSQAPADPFRSTDIRDVYGTILRHWMNVADPALDLILPPDPIPDPTNYWTVRNFNLPLFV